MIEAVGVSGQPRHLCVLGWKSPCVEKSLGERCALCVITNIVVKIDMLFMSVC